MKKCFSCRGIGITVSIAVLCLILSVVIGLTAHDRKCGTHRGMDCNENRLACWEDLPCYCSNRTYNPLVPDSGAYCKTRDRELTATARVFATVFGILFLVFVIASIVQCIVLACRGDMTPEPTVVIVPAKPVNEATEPRAVP